MANSKPSLSDKTLTALRQLDVSNKASILVAVSGGPDSLALLHVLKQLRDSQGYTLFTAHVNHLLRDEAKGEEELVRKYCLEWNIPLEVKQVDTRSIAHSRKKGIEETARAERYHFFQELAEERGVQYVVTAHTANDQAETVILNMIRGSGVRGLAGIPVKRRLGKAVLVRPWLSVTRDEICEYISEHDLKPAHDSSNEELTYQRNRVRHKVLPVLAEVYPDRSPVLSLSKLARRMGELSKFLHALTREKLEILRRDGGLTLSGVKNVGGLPLHGILETWINEEWGYYRLTDRETARISGFLNSDSHSIELRHGLRLKKESDGLRLEDAEPVSSYAPIPFGVSKAAVTPIGSISISLPDGVTIEKDRNKATFDRASISVALLQVRVWQARDRIAPFGLRGKTKLVSDLLNEAGIKGRKKKLWPVVVDSTDDSILWVPGVRASDRFRVTPETIAAIVLEFQPID